MAEIIFTFNTIPTSIQCNKNESMKEICQRFANKAKIDLSKVYFLYGGQTLDINQKFNNILKDCDKNSNRINILVYSYENKNENNNLEISKEIICSICRNICLINFNRYKINISECINNHNINDITLDEFQNLQKIDSSKIICNDCKSNNKRDSYNFYKCLSCKKDLCPLCMNRTHKDHDIIEYDKINYICNLHNESFNSFCKKCNTNLCMFCESEHKDKENIILYREILPKKDRMKNQVKELKNIINKMKEKIQEIKSILDIIITNLEIYIDINDNMIKNFEKKNRNFQLFKNMNELINYNNKIFNDLNIIKNENDEIKFFNYAFKIYAQMKKKNIIEDQEINEQPTQNKKNDIIQENENVQKNKMNNNQMFVNNNFKMNNKNMNAINAFNMMNNNMLINNMNKNMMLNNNMLNNNMLINNMNNNMMMNNNMNMMNNIDMMNNLNIMNNNMNMMNNINQASINPPEIEDTIFVTFTFKKNKKQIYIDISRNQTFKDAIDILNKKYEWLKKIARKYSLNNRIIKESEFNKTLTQLKIDENSDIIILTD